MVVENKFKIRGKFVKFLNTLCFSVISSKSSDRGKDKLPVMVYIFGGGYQSGSVDPYSPKYFMDKNVTLVTINYRLGVFGKYTIISN